MSISSNRTESQAHLTASSSSKAAPVTLAAHKVATNFIAFGPPLFWQPRPCRSPSPRLSFPPSPSSFDSSMMDLPDAYRKRRMQQPDNLPITDSWLFKGVRAVIDDLPLSEIEHVHEAVFSRRRIEVLAEYTWIQITKGQRMANMLFPAVYVPGQPRVWQGITTPSVPLNASSEPPAIIDEHLQRQKSFPYEPTFKVLHHLQQHTKFRHVDIVTDAATLATLFNFLADADPAKRAPFRLELATVRNTLFLATATHRGRGYTEKGDKGLIPAWVAPALTTLGTGGNPTGPLFLSGNHFRVVRYRLGAFVPVVRAKIDFTLENRAPLPRNEDPPFRGCQYERYNVTDEAGNDQVLGFQTLVKTGEGRGTRPDAAGLTSVRFAGWDCAATLAAKMPLLWFGRVPYVLDGVVSRDFEVTDTKLFCARQSYRAWEKHHQHSLKLMAGLLEQLQGIARAAGGNCIVIADPGQRCFRLHRPVIKHFPVPEALALAVWGPDESPAETVYATSTESDDDSALSQLSGTPSGFSNWKLEGDKVPEFHAAASHKKDADSRDTVESWLSDNDSEYDPSDDARPSGGKRPVPKKRSRAWINPVVQYMLPSGPRRIVPSTSAFRSRLDGAADSEEDEDEGADNEDYEEEIATNDTSDSREHVRDQDIKPDDEDDDDNNTS